jgi:long-chain acyl-CoA synthetase
VIGEGRPYLMLLAVSALQNEKQLCERANAHLKDFPGYTRIRHVLRVSEPWTVENGLLTPTLKLKRSEIEAQYKGEIEDLYKRPEPCGP